MLSLKHRFAVIVSIAFFICLKSTVLNAREPFMFYGCSGGMMIHSGFISSGKFNILNSQNEQLTINRTSGMPFGIGGIARVYLLPNFRVGGEGYFSSRRYAGNSSFCRIAWGGLLADWIYDFSYFSFYAGGAIGGGSYTNLSLYTKPKDDYIVEENASYRKYGFMALTPYVGIEFPLTDKISLNFMMDVILNVTHWSNDFTTGPRLHLGVLFNHYR